ncbi:hypothetical protein ANN_11027 [Periplaneta americana]|uniref:Uncharacterized protein n=1 Tax=Periplaneta americana TaxID=6978 RepID=A0ABQ8T3V2_PERAM|nr:hypothetical protein ANN_11027 [Periplaneta americana]
MEWNVFHSELEGRSSDTVIQEALASGTGHHSQQVPRGKRKAQHQNAMHEAVNRFTESYESRNLPRHGDAAFAEYITAELASLPEDIKDTAVMNIMKVLMDAKREKRSRFD